ncbi:hypothetical protein WR25_26796 [Diploscapter pachys]|uniref:Uncharacterized protein n=1 Tax=Diploscapter pachys TaxID=2018661 RepID=A0A2A2M3U7_9BILA|nr:hypothetical protein WR25_26796 [Diploscapter pachys]
MLADGLLSCANASKKNLACNRGTGSGGRQRPRHARLAQHRQARAVVAGFAEQLPATEQAVHMHHPALLVVAHAQVQFHCWHVVGLHHVHHLVAALLAHGVPQLDLGCHRQLAAKVRPGHLAAELEELAGFHREGATIVMLVVVIDHAGPDECHGIALLIQVHVPGMALGGQLAHGLDTVAEMSGEGIGIGRGDLRQGDRRMRLEAVRRHRTDQVALHPQQFPMEKHVALEKSLEGALEALLADAFL